jgi:hypothetical protein
MDMKQAEREYYEAVGALDAINILKDKLELRLSEARDECVREVWDNIIVLIESQYSEYHRRKEELREQME